MNFIKQLISNTSIKKTNKFQYNLLDDLLDVDEMQI